MQLLRIWYSRAFRTIPEAAKEQTGVAITSLLFALVISQLAIGLASQLSPIFVEVSQEEIGTGRSIAITYEGPPLSSERISSVLAQQSLPIIHYLVVVTLTITSAIGYYTSRNLPQLRVRFFNKAFLQFVLDTSMVFLYYLATISVEQLNSDGDARPEALFVSVAFALYLMWDVVSFWTSCSKLDQLALGRAPRRKLRYGWRRWVTLACGLLSLGILYSAVREGDDASHMYVVVLDTLLIALLLGYRLLKTLGDRNILAHSILARKCATDRDPEQDKLVPWSDLSEVLPREAVQRIELAIALERDADDGTLLLENLGLDVDFAHIEGLAEHGILKIQLRQQDLGVSEEPALVWTEIELTEFGRYVVAVYHNEFAGQEAAIRDA